MLSNSLVAGPVSFFVDVARFQIAPSGAWTTPPYPHMDFSTGFSTVAPAATAESNSALTLAGCATTRDIVNPRKPVVGASDACVCTWAPNPKASA